MAIPSPRRTSCALAVRGVRLALLACCFAGCSTSYTVRLTAAEVQQALGKKLPVSKSKLLITATVRALDVEFAEGFDRILLRPEVDVSVAGQRALSGRALAEGQIRYAPASGEFFLDQPQVKEVVIAGLPDAARPLAEELIARLGESYLDTMPVYRLRQSDFKQSLAKLVLKSVRVRHGRMEIVIGTP
jgi:Protein of unknown function (DUF1439)